MPSAPVSLPLPTAAPTVTHAKPRDLGPPTPAERTIIARILIRHGHLPGKIPPATPLRVSPW